MEVVREGIPEILQRSDAIQSAALNINYTLGAQLGNLQTCQQILLSEIKNCMDALPDVLENRVMLRLDDGIKDIVEVIQAPQLNYRQRSADMQKYVSQVILQISDAKFHQGPTHPYCSGKTTREAKPFARRL